MKKKNWKISILNFLTSNSSYFPNIQMRNVSNSITITLDNNHIYVTTKLIIINNKWNFFYVPLWLWTYCHAVCVIVSIKLCLCHWWLNERNSLPRLFFFSQATVNFFRMPIKYILKVFEYLKKIIQHNIILTENQICPIILIGWKSKL